MNRKKSRKTSRLRDMKVHLWVRRELMEQCDAYREERGLTRAGLFECALRTMIAVPEPTRPA